MNNDEPTMNPFVHAAALWLARNNWKDSPAYWAEQAQIRYGLSATETALLLLNMRIQLGHNLPTANPQRRPPQRKARG